MHWLGTEFSRRGLVLDPVVLSLEFLCFSYKLVKIVRYIMFQIKGLARLVLRRWDKTVLLITMV